VLGRSTPVWVFANARTATPGLTRRGACAACRPASAEETKLRVPQVIKCNEGKGEVRALVGFAHQLSRPCGVQRARGRVR
jgi:hypothetical protein